MLSQIGGGAARASENEARIESSFRRLLASVEAEREKIRSMWLTIDTETRKTAQELEKLRQDTEEVCHAERHKIQLDWTRLDKLREKMSVLYPNERERILEINCSGRHFSLPKSSLCNVEGSYLNHMFSDAFIGNVPRDQDGRFFLDFNADCFAMIVDYMKELQETPDAVPPSIPEELQMNMDILAEALNLKVLLRKNFMNPSVASSLQVKDNVIESTHQGWQVVAARDPLPMSGASYFEVRVLANPASSKGGLAIGVCGHIPADKEMFSIRMPGAVVYNSCNGLVGDCIDMENVTKKVPFKEGTLIGVKHDISNRSLVWYVDRLNIGTSIFMQESLEHMRVLYPIIALYVPGQKVQVDFSAISPAAARGGGVTGERTGKW